MDAIHEIEAHAYTIPTDAPESDGTLAWDSTTLVVVDVRAGAASGLGYGYTHAAAATLIAQQLAPVLRGRDPADVTAAWQAMRRCVRNLGRPGLAASAIAAVDVALWDLKARALGISLVEMLDAAHERVMAYGSGGFTSYDLDRLQRQLAGWAESGLRAVKMKVGREPARDVARVRAARHTIGDDVALFVDANGAYDRKQALQFAHAFADSGVTWFEEPVSMDDVDGLRLLRDRAPPGMDIAAGEYGYLLGDFRRLLDAGAVDVLQADATRAQGISGFLRAGTLCEFAQVPLSAHTAPTLHGHAGCAVLPLRHVEYFHDHARIEATWFDGALVPRDGWLRPDRSRPGHGLAFDRERAASLEIHEGVRA